MRLSHTTKEKHKPTFRVFEKSLPKAIGGSNRMMQKSAYLHKFYFNLVLLGPSN